MLLPPAVASAKVSAEKKVKRGSTLVTVINFTTANSDWFPLLNKISKRLAYSGIFCLLSSSASMWSSCNVPCEKSTVSSERKRRQVKKIGRVQTFSELYIFNLLGLIISFNFNNQSEHKQILSIPLIGWPYNICQSINSMTKGLKQFGTKRY